VTGGSGFIGSHLCERLLAEGCEVLCVDNFCTGLPENVAHLLNAQPTFELRKADVANFLFVPGPVDVVLNFASRPLPPTT